MKIENRPCISCILARAKPSVLLGFVVLFPALILAQSNKKNPSSKLFVSDINGEAQIDTGDNIQDLSKKSVYNAQGTVIETKKAQTESDKGKVFSTMVYSNGTGSFFGEDTRVEVKEFVQEPFTPNRTDMDVEPSISKTEAHISRGTVGLCAPKLVAGSTMNYNTALGSINIRGQKVVIQSGDQETKISMLEGDSTVRGGARDLGGHQLHSGEQAVIRPGGPGQPNIVTVQKIPPAEAAALEDKVAMACIAKKAVYFEVRDRPPTVMNSSGSADEGTASGGSSDNSSTGSSGSNSGTVTAFDGTPANSNNTGSTQVIVAIPVVPVNLPVQFTESTSKIISRPPGG